MGKKSFLIVYASDIVGIGNRDRLTALSKVWCEKGHNVSMLSTESVEDEFLEFVRKEGLPLKILTIPHTSAIKKLSYLNVILAYIPRILLGGFTKIPDDTAIVYSLTGIITEILPAFIFKLKKPELKWVALIDNLVFSPFDKRRKQLFLFKTLAYFGFLAVLIMCRKADIILTVNEPVKEGLIKNGIPKDKIVLTANGVILDEIFKTKVSGEKLFDGVFLGRLDYSKGILSLIDMWKDLCDTMGNNLKLAVIGKGTDSIEAHLIKRIRDKGLQENVHLLGYLSGTGKYKVLKSSRFFVFPSIDESWGIALMEALACGLPVIAYDLDTYKNIYPDELIERVPVGDAGKFLSSIKKIASSENTAENSRKRIDFAKEFNWTDVIEKEYSSIMGRI